MNKSVLVIDTPNSCVTCPLSFYNEVYSEHQCRGREYYRTITDYEWQCKQMCGKDTKPDYCPLRPLPEKIHKLNLEQYDGLIGEAKGWNNCVNYIMGENHEE